MNKLVDAEKLMELVDKDAAELAKQLPYRDHAPYVLAALRLKQILNEMDDGVIRCKDCKEACVKGDVTHWLECKSIHAVVDPDYYCCYGERKQPCA